jgi:hypothetical protein
MASSAMTHTQLPIFLSNVKPIELRPRDFNR